VYLYCASAGLATVIRAWFDRHALSQAMGLATDQQLLLAQTVGSAASDGEAGRNVNRQGGLLGPS